ncbi:MAG: hypothetical protein WCV56_06260 [Candidatus Omnitrophota bacterium]
MFTNSDYAEYFGETEDLMKDCVIIYTDLLNELNDNALKSKIEPMASESMENFRFIKTRKEKFLPNEK